MELLPFWLPSACSGRCSRLRSQRHRRPGTRGRALCLDTLFRKGPPGGIPAGRRRLCARTRVPTLSRFRLPCLLSSGRGTVRSRRCRGEDGVLHPPKGDLCRLTCTRRQVRLSSAVLEDDPMGTAVPDDRFPLPQHDPLQNPLLRRLRFLPALFLFLLLLPELSEDHLKVELERDLRCLLLLFSFLFFQKLQRKGGILTDLLAASLKDIFRKQCR